MCESNGFECDHGIIPEKFRRCHRRRIFIETLDDKGFDDFLRDRVLLFAICTDWNKKNFQPFRKWWEFACVAWDFCSIFSICVATAGGNFWFLTANHRQPTLHSLLFPAKNWSFHLKSQGTHLKFFRSNLKSQGTDLKFFRSNLKSQGTDLKFFRSNLKSQGTNLQFSCQTHLTTVKNHRNRQIQQQNRQKGNWGFFSRGQGQG